MAKLASSAAALRNVTVSELDDSGVTYPTYQNVTTGTLLQPNGRQEIVSLSLTGVSDAVHAGKVLVHQQGNEVTLDFTTPIVGHATGTEATLTGLPARYWPASDILGVLIIQDGGAHSIRPCLVAAGSGVITLSHGQSMAPSGTRGVAGGSIRYRRS
jgi:hypothetical protein